MNPSPDNLIAGPPSPSALPDGADPTTPTAETQALDLNDSWRSLMTAVGVGVPYHLNRAVRIVHLGHTWAR